MRKSEEDARRDAAKDAPKLSEAAGGEARRRDEARLRLRAEAEMRAKARRRRAARRREAALKLKADEDARFAADEAYRENLRQARAEALSKATIERQKREAIEDRKREKELVKALGDGSRKHIDFGSKPDTRFLPKAKRTTGGTKRGVYTLVHTGSGSSTLHRLGSSAAEGNGGVVGVQARSGTVVVVVP